MSEVQSYTAIKSRIKTSTPYGSMKANLTFDEYQKTALSQAIYSHDGEIPYLALGICGESGELADKVKKALRDKGGEFDAESRRALALELGDVIWYAANLANAIGFKFSEIAKMNREKIEDRFSRNVVHRVGDER